MAVVSARRAVWWSVTAVIVIAGVLWSVRTVPVPADLGTVTRGQLQVTLDQEGRTRVRQKYVVSSPVTGRLLRVGLEPGDPVDAGVVVARLVPAPAPLLDTRTRQTAEARIETAAATRRQAEATQAQAETAKTFADTELARMQRLFEGQAVAERDLEAAQTEADARAQAVAAAAAAAAAAEHELQAARAVLADAVADVPGGAGEPVMLRAPVQGVVLRRLHESETVVMAGEPVVEIADVTNLEIVADYLSRDAVQITAGMPAIIADWGGGEALAGHVRRVEPVAFVKVSALGVEEQRVNVILDVDDPERAWEQLGDGYRVTTRVITWQAPDVLQVPSSALFRQGDAWAAFVVGADGAVSIRAVDVGRDTGMAAEVRSGLTEGERVVLHPSDQISDGVVVEER